jgi:pimeloyl-ACP methyl ester carboxylesterase
VAPCRARWAAHGVDLAAYSSAERAADVRDLAVALRFGRINLVAARTMTVEAREIAGRYPGLVRSVTLLDVTPPQANPWNGAITAASGALDRFIGECLNDAACARRYPRLRQSIGDTYESYRKAPKAFDESSPFDGPPTRFRVLVDGDRLMQIVLEALNRGAAGLVPAALATKNIRAAAGFAVNTFAVPTDASWGARFSRDCIDLTPSVSPEGLSVEAQAAPNLAFLAADPMFDVCRVWGTPPRRTVAPGPTATPTLILVGSLDPFTSLDWAQQTAASFGHATVVQFPHTGAVDASVNPCVSALRRGFLDDPTRAISANACSRAVAPVTFTGTFTGT